MIIEQCKDVKLLHNMRKTIVCQIDRIIDGKRTVGDPEVVGDLQMEMFKIDLRLEELKCFHAPE